MSKSRRVWTVLLSLATVVSICTTPLCVSASDYTVPEEADAKGVYVTAFGKDSNYAKQDEANRTEGSSGILENGDVWGWYMNRMKADSIYKVGYYLTIQDYAATDEEKQVKFAIGSRYTGYRYKTVYPGIQQGDRIVVNRKLLVVIPVRGSAGREVKLWHESTIQGKIDKVVLAGQDYDFGRDPEYELIAEGNPDKANDGTIHIPAPGDWKPSSVSILGNIGIKGEAKTGDTLSVDLTGLNVVPGEDTYLYQWYCSDAPEGNYTPISGADKPFYLLTDGEAGKYIKVQMLPSGSSPYGRILEAATTEPVTKGIYLPESSDVTLNGTLEATYTVSVPSGNYHITSPEELSIGEISCSAKRLHLNGKVIISVSSNGKLTRNGGTETISYQLHTKGHTEEIFSQYEITALDTDQPRALAVTFDLNQWEYALPGKYSGAMRFTVEYDSGAEG